MKMALRKIVAGLAFTLLVFAASPASSGRVPQRATVVDPQHLEVLQAMEAALSSLNEAERLQLVRQMQVIYQKPDHWQFPCGFLEVQCPWEPEDPQPAIFGGLLAGFGVMVIQCAIRIEIDGYQKGIQDPLDGPAGWERLKDCAFGSIGSLADPRGGKKRPRPFTPEQHEPRHIETTTPVIRY